MTHDYNLMDYDELYGVTSVIIFLLCIINKEANVNPRFDYFFVAALAVLRSRGSY